jgi:predicted RNase H-like nuclease (RuvC/YqgF family)
MTSNSQPGYLKVANFNIYLPLHKKGFMEKAETLIAGIEYKVRKLIGQTGILLEENNQLKTEVNTLKAEIEKLESKVFELQEKQKTIKLAKSLNKEEKRTEVKLKINELVREIDHCIGLLNK